MELNDHEAWDLAATRPIGRIAHSHEDSVFVFPVNFLIVDQKVYLRSTAQSMVLAAARSRSRATIEIDDFVDWSKTGWSVLIQGELSEVTDAALQHRVLADLQSWADGVRNHVVCLTPHRISGRTFNPKPGGVRTVAV